MGTYEQKYREALKKAEAFYNSATTEPIAEREVLANIFPELKESDDERIRKEIISALKYANYKGVYDKHLAWLEKQGDKDKLIQELGEYKVKYTQEVLSQYLEKQGEQKVSAADFKAKDWYVSKVDGKIHNIYHSADKVEPKFHEGEWLCENEPNNYARFIQILEIVNVQGKERYRISRDIHNDKDVVEFDFVEKYYHKFDIKDVKDGDILVSGKLIILFKKFEEYTDYTFIIAYAGIDISGKLQITNEHEHWLIDNKAKPATKEQRDILFQKMKEAGYEWDADKKELKKSQRLISAEAKEALYGKPAWNEEDERIRKALIDYFDDANKTDENPLQSYGIHTDKAIAWLEKQGEQKHSLAK